MCVPALVIKNLSAAAMYACGWFLQYMRERSEERVIKSPNMVLLGNIFFCIAMPQNVM